MKTLAVKQVAGGGAGGVGKRGRRCIGAAGCRVGGREIYKCLPYIVSEAV